MYFLKFQLLLSVPGRQFKIISNKCGNKALLCFKIQKIKPPRLSSADWANITFCVEQAFCVLQQMSTYTMYSNVSLNDAICLKGNISSPWMNLEMARSVEHIPSENIMHLLMCFIFVFFLRFVEHFRKKRSEGIY